MKKSTKIQWIKILIFGDRFSSLGWRVGLAACLGILSGLLFGKFCLALKPLADIFSMLLQAVVLPYVCFSIIQGLGSLTLERAIRLWKSGWFYFFVVWILAFLVILGASYWIPSPNLSIITMADHPRRLSEKFLRSFIPQNPFYDLTNNILPAVAIFGVILGTALMVLEKKEPLLGIFERISIVLEKIFDWLIVIAPIGVFTLLAVNFGSVSWDQLHGLLFYLLVFFAIALFISLVLLPLLVSCLTSMSFGEVRHAFLFVCFLPFATGLVTMTIPVLIAYLGKKWRLIASLAYTGGQIGNAMMIFFILFLSYYFSYPFQEGEDIFLSMLSIPLAIGSSTNSMDAISFLFEQLNLPKNAMPLFVHSSVFTNHFQALMSASAILTLTLLINHSYERSLQLNTRRIAFRVALPLGCVMVVIAVLKPFMHPADYYPHLYQNLRLADIMKPVPAVVYKEQPWDHLRENPDQQILEILQTRVLKVGYHGLETPYCYWNKAGELVGYDVAYAHQLARDLDCTLEFVPLVFGHLKEEINAGLYDIAMSAIIMSEKRIINMSFTAPYDEQNFVLIVPVKESKQYTHLASAANLRGLKIGGTGVFLEVIQRHFPLADPIDLTVDEQIAWLQEGKLDAIMWERASAFIWSLSHPDFIAIDYSGLIGRGYLSYGFHTNSPKFASFLNNWLTLKQLSGFNEKMRNYWFDGVKE